jgi:hypothetical protein
MKAIHPFKEVTVTLPAAEWLAVAGTLSKVANELATTHPEAPAELNRLVSETMLETVQTILNALDEAGDEIPPMAPHTAN